MTETQQVIYSMVRVGRVHPPNRQVLRDISLGFYYGAKIGVLGLNGAGKSTLLRIMAGVDDGYLGETMLSKGYTRGLLEQEPQLDPNKTVRQVIEEAVQPIVDMLKEFDEVTNAFGEPDADFDALIEKQGKLQEELDKHDAWNLDNKLEQAMEALRCPPGDAPVSILSGGERRRVALTRLLLTEPDILLLDEPTNHLDAESVGWLEKHLQGYAGTVIAVTHDRYFLDNVAQWILELDRGYGIPWRGNYSSWLEQKQERLRKEEKADTRRIRTLERELEWIRMSPRARQSKGKARVSAYEKLLSEETEQRREEMQIYIPPGPRLGDVVIDFDKVSKTYDDTDSPGQSRLIFENLTFQMPPGVHRRRDRAERRGQDDHAPPDHPPGAAHNRYRAYRADGRVGLRRPKPRDAQRRQNGLGGDLGRRRDDHAGAAQSKQPGLRLGVQLPRVGPAEAGGRSIGRRAQPGAPGEGAAAGRERAPPRRADQRPGREHSARAGRSAERLRRQTRWSSAMTAGFSTASARISSRSRRTAACSGLSATARTTRRTAASGWASPQKRRTALCTAS